MTYRQTLVVGQGTLPTVLKTGNTVQKVGIVLVESPANGQIGVDINQVSTRLIMDVSSSTVDPARSTLLVEPVEPPRSSVSVIIPTTIDIDINDGAEEILKKTLSTVVEAWGTVGEVWVVKVVESLADLDGGINVNLIVSSVDHCTMSYSPSHHKYDPSSSLVGHRPNKGSDQRSSW